MQNDIIASWKEDLNSSQGLHSLAETNKLLRILIDINLYKLEKGMAPRDTIPNDNAKLQVSPEIKRKTQKRAKKTRA
jgi:hypothetical protein